MVPDEASLRSWMSGPRRDTIHTSHPSFSPFAHAFRIPEQMGERDIASKAGFGPRYVISAQDKHRWELIGRLEMNLRRLTADVLSEKMGPDAWGRGIPPGTQTRIEKNFIDHQKRAIDSAESLEIRLEECDLGGLYEILRTNWDSCFAGLFQHNRPVFDMQADIVSRMRNALDHYRRDLLPTGEEDPSLRPTFDAFLPLQLRQVLRGLASRGLTCVDIADEEGRGTEREDPPVLSRRDYVHFVGRIQEIAELLQRLGDPTPLVVVLGIGGVGKTATCVEVGLRAFRAGMFDEIVYASAKRGYLLREQAAMMPAPLSNLTELLKLVLDTLGSSYTPSENITELKNKALSALADQDTLIVLDNFETMEDQAECADFFWQVPPSTKVLISSRIPPSTGGRFIFLSELKRDDVREIIEYECALKGRPRLIPVDKPPILNAVYDAIGGIPLAAKLLVGMMVVEWKGLESALETFRNRDKNTLVDFCFGEIYNKVLSEDARALFRTMTMASLDASLAELEASSGLAGANLTDALMALEQTSLVARSTSPEGVDVYRMLPLTRMFARSKLLESSGLESTVRKRLQEYARRLAESGSEALSPSAHEALRLANLARMKLRIGSIQDAIENAKRAVETSDEVPFAYLVYGMAEEARGNLVEAERILESGHKKFPGDQRITHKLAMTKSLLEKFEEASKLYRSILVLDPKSQGEIIQTEYSLGGLAANLANWVRNLRQQNKFREVRKRTQEFIDLIDREIKYPGPLPRETDFLVKVARYNLGRELSIAGEYELAERYLIGAFVTRPQYPKDGVHNGSVFRALEINLQKWNPGDAGKRRDSYLKQSAIS